MLFAVGEALRLNSHMSSAHLYSVETASPKALLIGLSSPLSVSLEKDLNASHIETELMTLKQFFSGSPSLNRLDYDYLAVALSSDLLRFLQVPENRNHWLEYFSHSPAAPRPLLLVHHLLEKSSASFTQFFDLVVYGDYLAGEGGQAPVLDKILTSCRDLKTIALPESGLERYYLLSLSDLVPPLSALLVAPSRPPLTALFPATADSLLNISYQIRSLFPYKITLTFNSPQNLGNLGRAGDLAVQTPPQSLFTPYIDNFFAAPPPVLPSPSAPRHEAPSRRPLRPAAPEPTPPASPISSPKPVFVPVKLPGTRRPRLTPLSKIVSSRLPKPRRKILPPGARIALGSLLVGIALYLSSLIICSLITYRVAVTTASSFTAGGVLPAHNSLATPAAVFLQANLSLFTSLPGLNNISSLIALNNLLSSYLLVLDINKEAATLGALSQDISQYVLGEGEGDILALLNSASVTVSSLYDRVSLLDGSLPATPPPVIPTDKHSNYQSLKSKISETRRALLTGKSLMGVAPDILALGTRKKYAILFQNNMELRPTGGFIGSFGILSFENGKLFDISIYDVYTADGQLKGHVEPPAEIKEYLGEANWYLRDSNWDPDFPTSARRVEWFLEKSLGLSVQGTIAINVNTLTDVLSALGPIHLLDYNEDVSASNIYEKTQHYAENGFFPGSTAKKEFLASVADNLLGKLRTVDQATSLNLVRALTKSIDEKNTLLSLGNSTTQATLSSLGWNGELENLPCPELGGPCVADYAMLVDSNFGINKANYYLERKLDLFTEISEDNTILHTLTATYTNTAKSSSWPAGVYKSYSRFYIPDGSTPTSLMIAGQNIPLSEVNLRKEHNRTVLGYLLQVPLDSTVEVKLDYRLSHSLASAPASYSLYWQKQSGTQADPLSIRLRFPTRLTPDIVSPTGNYQPGTLDFNLSNVTDRRITVKFK